MGTARALIREMPEYDYYWHLPGIRMADGAAELQHADRPLPRRRRHEDRSICASGFNLVASATRDGKRLTPW